MNLKAEIDYDSAEAGDEGEIGKLISICLYVLEKQGKQSKIPHHDKKPLEKIANQVKSWFGPCLRAGSVTKLMGGMPRRSCAPKHFCEALEFSNCSTALGLALLWSIHFAIVVFLWFAFVVH